MIVHSISRFLLIQRTCPRAATQASRLRPRYKETFPGNLRKRKDACTCGLPGPRTVEKHTVHCTFSHSRSLSAYLLSISGSSRSKPTEGWRNKLMLEASATQGDFRPADCICQCMIISRPVFAQYVTQKIARS